MICSHFMLAYLDPSVMSYVLQAAGGATLVLGLVVGSVWHRIARHVRGAARADDAREVEPPVVRVRRGADGGQHRTAGDPVGGRVTASEPQAVQRCPQGRGQYGGCPRGRGRYGGLGGDFLVAFALGFFVCVVLPVQTYLANASLFVFTPGRLAVETGVALVAVTVVLWVLLRCCGRTVGAIMRALLLAALVGAFLEAGVLSTGLPEINGGFMPALAVKSRAAWDLVAWMAAFVALPLVLWRKRRAAPFVALAMILLSLCFLFDVRRERAPSAVGAKASGGGFSSGFEWQRDVIENFRYSPKRNVLVFILDSMPGNLSHEFVASDPAVRAKFAGFTAFTNCVAMHDCTKYGLPGLMTGRYFEPGVSSEADYPMTIFGEESFLQPYVRGGAEVFFAGDLLPYGYTNGAVTRRLEVRGRQKHGWAAALLRSREVPYLSLLDMVVFRLSPYVLKAPFLYAKIRHDPMMGRDESAYWYEHVMYPTLGRSPLSDSATTLGVFHSRGAHPPLVFDPDGRAYPSPRVGRDRATVAELVSMPLRHLARLMDALRARGLYDTSLIVVVADHGLDLAPHAPGRDPSESAILWVKPEGAEGPLTADPRPTGYAKVAGLMRELEKGRLDIRAIGRALEEPYRLYRHQHGDGFKERVIGP